MTAIENTLAGAAGGALFGILGYLNAMRESEAFDARKFLISLIPATVAGLAAGLAATDISTAFLAGYGASAATKQATKLIN